MAQGAMAHEGGGGAAQGTVHDLAYKRYEGRRTTPTWRFLVIVRQAVLAQFKLRATKAFLVVGVLISAVGAAILAFTLRLGMSRLAEAAAITGADPVRQMAGESVVASQALMAFLLFITCAAPAVSDDLRAGAFQFYFARPVSRVHYLLARVLAAAAWPLALAVVNAGLYLGVVAMFHTSAAALAIAGRAVGPMLLKVLVFAAVATGVSSITRRRALAQALFGALVAASMLLTGAAQAIAARASLPTGGAVRVDQLMAAMSEKSWIVGLGIGGSAETLGQQALGAASRLTGWHAAVPGVAVIVWIAGAIALAYWRLVRAEVVRG